MKYVCVNFDEGNNTASSGKGYCYFTDIDGWEVGDKAVVQVRGGSSAGKLHVVTVCKVGANADERSRAHEWIIQKVDMAAYDARIEKQKRREELFEKLDAIKAEADRMAKYETLAAGGNKEAKALVKELKAL
jgi:hypothetical protein